MQAQSRDVLLSVLRRKNSAPVPAFDAAAAQKDRVAGAETGYVGFDAFCEECSGALLRHSDEPYLVCGACGLRSTLMNEDDGPDLRVFEGDTGADVVRKRHYQALFTTVDGESVLLPTLIEGSSRVQQTARDANHAEVLQRHHDRDRAIFVDALLAEKAAPAVAAAVAAVVPRATKLLRHRANLRKRTQERLLKKSKQTRAPKERTVLTPRYTWAEEKTRALFAELQRKGFISLRVARLSLDAFSDLWAMFMQSAAVERDYYCTQLVALYQAFLVSGDGLPPLPAFVHRFVRPLLLSEHAISASQRRPDSDPEAELDRMTVRALSRVPDRLLVARAQQTAAAKVSWSQGALERVGARLRFEVDELVRQVAPEASVGEAQAFAERSLQRLATYRREFNREHHRANALFRDGPSGLAAHVWKALSETQRRERMRKGDRAYTEAQSLEEKELAEEKQSEALVAALVYHCAHNAHFFWTDLDTAVLKRVGDAAQQTKLALRMEVTAQSIRQARKSIDICDELHRKAGK